MSDIVIRVDSLGKRYRLGARQQGGDGRRSLSNLVTAPFSYLRSALREPDPDEIIWALKDVSFEVKCGEVVGIIGRNGAGKTTLLKILSRITEPTEGRAEIHGRVGSLLEVGTGFHPELTGRENIYLNGAILGMRKVEIDRKFDEIVAFAEIEKFMDTPVKRYSSGMYVRLAFAVAAHLEPEILLVDEVLAVGDAVFQKKCLGKMGDVAKEGRTVLFVSHNMAAIQGLCSRCCLLHSGKLVAEGSPRNVIEQYLVNLLQGAPISLSEREDRKGSGEIKLVEVSILNAKGKPIDYAFSGQDVAIAISYYSRDGKPVSRLDVHVTFYTVLGQFMFNCSSESSGYSFNSLPPQGRVVCYIPELPLAPGRYVFNLFTTVGGMIADWVQQAGYLNVAAGDYFGTGQLKTHEGGFVVKHRWIFENLYEVSQPQY
jgi:lipopolysaccharide transport system ATP-binding protein